MQRMQVSCEVRRSYRSLGVQWLSPISLYFKKKYKHHCVLLASLVHDNLVNLRRIFGKYRTFCHTKIFIHNRKEIEYAGFITHLHLLLHIVTLDTEAIVVPWHKFTYSLLVPEGRLDKRAQILRFWKCSVTISYTTVRDTSGHCSYTSLIVKCQFYRLMRFTFCFNASVMTEFLPDLSASWTSVRPFLNIVHHFRTLAAFITCSP